MIATSFAVVNGGRERFKNFFTKSPDSAAKGLQTFGSEEFALTVYYNPKIARR